MVTIRILDADDNVYAEWQVDAKFLTKAVNYVSEALTICGVEEATKALAPTDEAIAAELANYVSVIVAPPVAG